MPLLHTDLFPDISYQKTGSGPVIVLLHGFPENGTLWDNIVPALSVNYTLIVPDLPGSGNSTFGDVGAVTIESLAEAVNMILEAEGIEQVVMAGHSMGGYVALAFADKYRYKLKGLSLVHSHAAPDTDEKKQNRMKVIELVKKGGKDAFIRQMVPNLFSSYTKTQHPAKVSEQVAVGATIKDESIIAFYAAMAARPDRSQLLKEIGFPVQWVMGKDDNVAPVQQILNQSHISSVNFVSLYSRCGHMSMVELPERLSADISAFAAYCYKR